MSDDLDAVRQLLPDVALRRLGGLRAGERSWVERVEACWPDASPTTVIVKRFHHFDESWLRESAALAVLPPGEASRLIAAGPEPPVIVTEDLGSGPNVADALLGDDLDTAWHAVRQWATAVGRLHAASAGLEARFDESLRARAGDRHIPASRVSVELNDAARTLDGHCAALGVSVPSGALDALRDLRHLGTAECEAISPSDTCPDNNVRVGERLVLIDFEGAQWRHVAWDVAYLFVPWPSCWCAWAIPPELSRQAFTDYRAAAEVGLPSVREDRFEHDVQAATVGWALTSTTWYLDTALGDDPTVDPERPAPSRRAMILHRLAVAAAASDIVPPLAELAANLGAALTQRWGDLALEPARAFAGR